MNRSAIEEEDFCGQDCVLS